jgi:agmatinase
MDRHDELRLLLKPAGGGLYVVSTGKAAQLALQRKLYGAADEAGVKMAHEAALGRLAEARGFILGVPSDVGAGFRRGANMGPQAVRTAWLEGDPEWPQRLAAAGVVDLGDVFCVPQLLHDDMLSAGQREASARVLYPELPPADAITLPVSPLSITERVLDLVFAINPTLIPFVIGGDHSVAWPVSAALARARTDRWAIVQPDAHTDLLEQRLGVKYCFATWSFHANELFGRDGRMVQVGTRASGRDRGHWESTYNVRQFWADECRANPAQTIDGIIAHLKSVGATSVYLSNDIDGTDQAWADATGTPEPAGLEPRFLLDLIRRLGADIGICAGDIMEVAPPLGRDDRTVKLAARYLRATMAAALAVSL